MKYLAACSLLSLAGKDITADSVKAVLASVGSKVDDKELNATINALKGKNMSDVIAKGLPKVGSAGSAVAPSATAAVAPTKKE